MPLSFGDLLKESYTTWWNNWSTSILSTSTLGRTGMDGNIGPEPIIPEKMYSFTLSDVTVHNLMLETFTRSGIGIRLGWISP